MTFSLGARSRTRLVGVHPDLVRVVERAIQLTPIDFTVLEGVRTLDRQKELFASGASTTLRSRHLNGFAVDIAPFVNGEVRWDWPLYLHLAEAMRLSSLEQGTPIRWGGTWKLLGRDKITMSMLSRKFPDGPHFELPSSKYPDPRR